MCQRSLCSAAIRSCREKRVRRAVVLNRHRDKRTPTSALRCLLDGIRQFRTNPTYSTYQSTDKFHPISERKGAHDDTCHGVWPLSGLLYDRMPFFNCCQANKASEWWQKDLWMPIRNCLNMSNDCIHHRAVDVAFGSNPFSFTASISQSSNFHMMAALGSVSTCMSMHEDGIKFLWGTKCTD